MNLESIVKMDRYDPVARYLGCGDYAGDMELDPKGDWVSYDVVADMVMLEKENTDLRAKLDEADKLLAKIHDDLKLRAELKSYRDSDGEAVVEAVVELSYRLWNQLRDRIRGDVIRAPKEQKR